MIGSYLGSLTSMPGVPGSLSMAVPLLQKDVSSLPGEKSMPRMLLKMTNLVAGIRGMVFPQG